MEYLTYSTTDPILLSFDSVVIADNRKDFLCTVMMDTGGSGDVIAFDVDSSEEGMKYDTLGNNTKYHKLIDALNEQSHLDEIIYQMAHGPDAVCLIREHAFEEDFDAERKGIYLV